MISFFNFLRWRVFLKEICFEEVLKVFLNGPGFDFFWGGGCCAQ